MQGDIDNEIAAKAIRYWSEGIRHKYGKQPRRWLITERGGNNHIHQATNKIVKTKPSVVVMETLNIKAMMKNKHLSKEIAAQSLNEFKRQIKYKCEFNGIKFVEADKWYPSSKMCSCCGNIKKDLKLSDRKYICEECGHIVTGKHATLS